MKFALKSLVLAAAAVASGVASAAVITTTPGVKVVVTDPLGSGRRAELSLISGGGSLEFSNGTGVLGGIPTTAVGGLVGALNVGKVKLTGVDDAVVTETSAKVGRSVQRAAVSISANVNSLSADDQTGQILTVGAVGGAQQDADYLEGVLDGGRVTVRNLKFDLPNKTVFADMSGQALLADGTLGTLKTANNIALWNITSITGPTAIPPEALLAAGNGDLSKMEQLGYTVIKTEPVAGDPAHLLYTVGAVDTLNNLKITKAGFDFFAESFGLAPGSTGYTTLAGVNAQVDGWGSARSNITFTARELAAVPEPSTYALMSLGLVGIGMAARRRAK